MTNFSARIRFAIWAAVSTAEQAKEDKFSLQEQESHCRATAIGKGWEETAGPYIVRGESRTRFVNLSDAEQAIPELKILLDDALAGKFDVIICYEFDRFRELLDPVARSLSYYGVQLYSVSQPLEPQKPEAYSPYSNDSEFILRGMNQMISRSAVATLRRKYFANMPKRITEKGLAGASIPWGYRKPLGRETDSSAVPEQVPDLVRWLIMMKDMVLAGKSTYQIAAELDTLGAPVPRNWLHKKTKGIAWDPTSIRRMLRNPYYSGYVRWGVTKTKRDIRTGNSTLELQPANQIIIAKGKHQPLWDSETHEALMAELERRAPSHRGSVTRQLTGLLRCSVCGALLWRHTQFNRHKPDSPHHITWRCHVGFASHVVVRDEAMLDAVAKELVNQIANQDSLIVDTKSFENELEALRQKRTRIGDAFTNGLFNLAEFSRRADEVDKKIAELEEQQKNENIQVVGAQMHRRAIAILREVMSKVDLAEYLRTFDKQGVNTTLHYIISEIVVDHDGNIVKVVSK